MDTIDIMKDRFLVKVSQAVKPSDPCSVQLEQAKGALEETVANEQECTSLAKGYLVTLWSLNGSTDAEIGAYLQSLTEDEAAKPQTAKPAARRVA